MSAWLSGKWPWVGVGLLLAVAALLRLFRLEEIPPGLHYDEAVYGLMAQEILRGRLPIYFPAYTGREPLYMYLMAGVFRGVEVGIFGVRFTSALIGLLALPATYLLGRKLFSPRVGFLAAALLTFSFWHLVVSRNAIANVLLPTMEALALYFLWQGYQDGKMRGFILGGIITGLILYTWYAARFFPLLLLVFLLYLAIVERARFAARWPGLLLAGLVALLTFTPLGLYFWQNPQDFWERADQVLIFSQVQPERWPGLLTYNTAKTLGAFFIEGEPKWRFNISGRPIFDPIIGTFFLIGLVLSLRKRREGEYALLPLWLAVMSLPAIVTEDLMPQSQRMSGIMPGVFLIAALGLDRVWSWSESRVGVARRALIPLGLGLLFVGEGIETYRSYFDYWAQRAAVYQTFDGAYTDMLPIIRGQWQAKREVIIGSLHYRHPTLAFLLPRTTKATWMLGGRTLVFPYTQKEELAYVIGLPDNPLHPQVASYLASLAYEVETYTDPKGNPAIRVYRLQREKIPQPGAGVAEMSLNGELLLQEVSLADSVRRDENLSFFISWSVLHPPPAARSLVVHLVDERGVLWSQTSEPGYIWDQWHPGDQVYQWLELPLERTMPSGRYELRLLLTDASANPLPVLKVDGGPQGIFIPLGEVQITPQGGLVDEISTPGLPFGEALQALEFTLPTGSLVPGGRLEFSVTWQALRALQDLSAQIELRDAEGRAWASYLLPLAYDYPTSQWQVGEVVRPVYAIDLGADVVPGRTQVILTLPGLSGELNLGTVEILGEERLFEMPAIQHLLPAVLGDEGIAFLGYDLPKGELRLGEELTLHLYWQAQAPVAQSYKVFVHFVDATGQVILQDDAVPAGWSRPTTGWAQGEIIIDEHRLLIPSNALPGEYRIVVGMYDEETLQRLPVYDAAGDRQPQDRLLLGSIRVVNP